MWGLWGGNICCVIPVAAPSNHWVVAKWNWGGFVALWWLTGYPCHARHSGSSDLGSRDHHGLLMARGVWNETQGKSFSLHDPVSVLWVTFIHSTGWVKSQSGLGWDKHLWLNNCTNAGNTWWKVGLVSRDFLFSTRKILSPEWMAAIHVNERRDKESGQFY